MAEQIREWQAEVRVMLKPSVNDPPGQSIRGGLHTLGYPAVSDVRAGKLIKVRLTAPDQTAAEQAVTEMASRLLANPVIETFEVSVQEFSRV